MPFAFSAATVEAWEVTDDRVLRRFDVTGRKKADGCDTGMFDDMSARERERERMRSAAMSLTRGLAGAHAARPPHRRCAGAPARRTAGRDQARPFCRSSRAMPLAAGPLSGYAAGMGKASGTMRTAIRAAAGNHGGVRIDTTIALMRRYRGGLDADRSVPDRPMACRRTITRDPDAGGRSARPHPAAMTRVPARRGDRR